MQGKQHCTVCTREPQNSILKFLDVYCTITTQVLKWSFTYMYMNHDTIVRVSNENLVRRNNNIHVRTDECSLESSWEPPLDLRNIVRTFVVQNLFFGGGGGGGG